jgi:hypothetical protein
VLEAVLTESFGHSKIPSSACRTEASDDRTFVEASILSHGKDDASLTVRSVVCGIPRKIFCLGFFFGRRNETIFDFNVIFRG